MRFVTTVTCLLVLSGCLFASDRKARGQGAWAWANATATAKPVASTPAPTGAECKDALDEVNAERAKRGLPPFKHDAKLTEAAYACAKERASRGIHGHLPESDFKHLSKSVPTEGVAAGCAAWEDGFGACAMYDNYAYCGAAWVRGADGLKYCHIFVKGESPAVFKSEPNAVESFSAGSCASGSCGTATMRGRRGR